MPWKLHEGDCAEVLKQYPDNYFETCITDPPYGMSMKDWDKEAPSIQCWEQVYRVLKPGANILVFGGTRTHHRLMCALEDVGFDLKDMVMWLYSQGFPKALNISKSIAKRVAVQSGGKVDDWRGFYTQLKPAYEPIVLAMKPLEGSYADNALEHGVAGLAIDKTRIPSQTPVTINTWDDGAKPFGGGAGSPYTTRQSTRGRWPANVVFDEGAARQLDQQSGITKSAATPPTHQQPAYPGNSNTNFLRGVSHSENQYNDEGGASRFFYCSKVSVKERTHNGRVENIHPTVKPLALLKYLSELTSTPYHSTVLDPFAGTASMGIAALETGRSYVGIELDSDYALTARKRLIDTWIRINRNTIREEKHNTISEAIDTTLKQDSSL